MLWFFSVFIYFDLTYFCNFCLNQLWCCSQMPVSSERETGNWEQNWGKKRFIDDDVSSARIYPFIYYYSEATCWVHKQTETEDITSPHPPPKSITLAQFTIHLSQVSQDTRRRTSPSLASLSPPSSSLLAAVVKIEAVEQSPCLLPSMHLGPQGVGSGGDVPPVFFLCTQHFLVFVWIVWLCTF